jgi:hypothetical protein
MESPEVARTLIAVGSIAVGLVLCFFGQRLFAAVVALSGFLLGALLGGTVAALLELSEAVVLAVAVVAGILFAALFRGVLLLAVFTTGALGLGLLCAPLALGLHGIERALLTGAVALAGGLLALKLRRPVIALSTAVAGAAAVIGGAVELLGGPGAARAMLDRAATAPAPSAPDLVALLLWLAIAAAGTAAQMRTAPKKD